MRALIALALLLVAPAHAADPTPAALLNGLAGEWSGALVYRDYQSNREERIPMARTVTALSDAATTLTVARFTDPGAQVFIHTLTMVDGSSLRVAGVRAGRAPFASTATIALATGATPTRFTMTTTRDGEDDDKPARIRETLTRDGDRLTELKEVDPKDDGREGYQFRNRTELTRGR